jgi:hypothetical protein
MPCGAGQTLRVPDPKAIPESGGQGSGAWDMVFSSGDTSAGRTAPVHEHNYAPNSSGIDSVWVSSAASRQLVVSQSTACLWSS